MTVVGDPQFRFSLGRPGESPESSRRFAAYDAASSTATRLVFSYTVLATDEAPNGISIGDHRTTWDLDANDLIRTSAPKVDIDFTHTGINTQANHKVNGNPPPTAADNTVTTDEDVVCAFQAGDFNFTDDVNADDELASVTIVTLPAAGALAPDGTEVTADQEVTRA